MPDLIEQMQSHIAQLESILEARKDASNEWQQLAKDTFQLLGLSPTSETPEAYREKLEEWAQRGRMAGLRNLELGK